MIVEEEQWKLYSFKMSEVSQDLIYKLQIFWSYDWLELEIKLSKKYLKSQQKIQTFR